MCECNSTRFDKRVFLFIIYVSVNCNDSFISSTFGVAYCFYDSFFFFICTHWQTQYTLAVLHIHCTSHCTGVSIELTLLMHFKWIEREQRNWTQQRKTKIIQKIDIARWWGIDSSLAAYFFWFQTLLIKFHSKIGSQMDAFLYFPN